MKINKKLMSLFIASSILMQLSTTSLQAGIIGDCINNIKLGFCAMYSNAKAYYKQNPKKTKKGTAITAGVASLSAIFKTAHKTIFKKSTSTTLTLWQKIKTVPKKGIVLGACIVATTAIITALYKYIKNSDTDNDANNGGNNPQKSRVLNLLRKGKKEIRTARNNAKLQIIGIIKKTTQNKYIPKDDTRQINEIKAQLTKQEDTILEKAEYKPVYNALQKYIDHVRKLKEKANKTKKDQSKLSEKDKKNNIEQKIQDRINNAPQETRMMVVKENDEYVQEKSKAFKTQTRRRRKKPDVLGMIQ